MSSFHEKNIVPGSKEDAGEGALLKSVVETVVDGILTINEDGIVISANPAVESIFGYQLYEIVGRNVKMLMPEPFHTEHDQYLTNYSSTGIRKIIGIGREVSGKRKNGQIFPMELAVGEALTPSGKIFTGIVRDITDRKQSEELLRSERALFRAVVDTAVDGIITINEVGTIQTANPATQTIFGYSADELIGQNVRILMPDLYQREHDQYLRNYLETGDAKVIGIGREVQGLRKDGHIFPIDLSVSETTTDKGRIFTGIVRDISQRKESEELLKENQRLMHMASQLSHMGAWSVDLPSQSVTWSDEVKKIFGVDDPNLLDFEDLFAAYVEPHRSEVKRAFDICLSQGTPFDLEVKCERDGTEFWVRVLGEAVVDSLGETTRVQGAIQDITEQKIAASTLAASEERFRTLANSMPMIVWTATSDGDVDYSNQYFTEYTGIPQTEPPASRWQQTLHPDDVDKCIAEWTRCLEHKCYYEIEYRLKQGSTGYYRWFLVQAQPVLDENGDVTKWYGTGTDIHDTKALQEEASILASSLKTTLESITDGFITMDHDWRFTYVNSAAEDLLFKSREEMLGQVAWDFFPESVGSSFYHNYHKAVAEGVSISFEEYFEPIDRWLDLHAYPSTEGLAVHFRDISDRKHAQRKLEEQTNLLVDAQRIGQMGSYTLDLVSGVLNWSESFKELIGRKSVQQSATLEEFFSIVHPDDVAKVKAATAKEYIFGEALENQFRICKPNGEVIWVAIRGTTEFDQEGRAFRRVGMMRDITAQKLAAEALQRTNIELESMVAVRTAELEKSNLELKLAKESAESANLFKSAFLSRMSHELRTPMNAILGFGQLLELSDLDDESQDSLSHIMKAGRHLLNLINDVLEISRVEIGEIGLSLEPVEILELLTECESLMRTIAIDHKVSIQINVKSSIYVWADRQKLRQVFLNVISNGIKYNVNGGTLNIIVSDVEGDTVQVKFTDSGVGIEPDCMARLFMPFERFSTVETEGTGLGLSLSKSLMEAMGGTLTAESEYGKGSTFTVVVRHADHRAEDVSVVYGEDLSNRVWDMGSARILVIEDNLTNVALLERLFASRPEVELLVAMQGGLGLELARKHKPDVILLDLHLPDIQGDILIETFKNDSLLVDIPVIIVSADAFKHRAEQLLKLGAFKYVTKPFDLTELMQCIDEALGIGKKGNA